jgi:hypothetical protein
MTVGSVLFVWQPGRSRAPCNWQLFAGWLLPSHYITLLASRHGRAHPTKRKTPSHALTRESRWGAAQGSGEGNGNTYKDVDI